MGKMRILAGLAFHVMEQMQPQYHCRIYRYPVGGRSLNCRFHSWEASSLFQPMVEVSHRRFYRYDSESGGSDISIYSSGDLHVSHFQYFCVAFLSFFLEKC